MTQLLTSVQSLDEAVSVAEVGTDILDLKDPRQGALGAVNKTVIQHITQQFSGQIPISVTIGDVVTMDVQTIAQRVKQRLMYNIDYIKIGFFPTDADNYRAVLHALSPLTKKRQKLIAVFFVDQQKLESIDSEAIKQAGFAGVMLDTANKQQGHLLHHCRIEQLTRFIKKVKNQRLLSGLAGSLRECDIKKLNVTGVDYLGFRGALCQQQQRQANIDKKAVERIKDLLNSVETQHNYFS